MHTISILTVLSLAAPLLAVAQSIHDRAEFRFTLDVDYATAAPLFGALAEMQWDPDWKPDFIYPTPARDEEGAVFRVRKGSSHDAVWMLTVFDLPGGRVQYALVLNQIVFTRIDIHLSHNGPHQTDVAVAYEWTALDPSSADHIKALSHGVSSSGPHWKAAIESSVRNRAH